VNDTDGEHPGSPPCPACGGAPVDPIRPYLGLGVFCRACFLEEDRRSEALELAAFPPFAPDPAGVELDREALLAGVTPKKRRATTAAEFVGQRFGELEVLGVAHRTRGDGRALVCLRLRCSCEAEYLVAASGFRKRRQQACRSCAAIAARRRQAKVLVAGETIGHLAQRLGITHQAVRLRLRRGWQLHELGAPARRRANPERKAA
jgi:hypothetical protein